MRASDILGNSVYFKKYAARAHFKNVMFRVALAAPHANFSRLRGNRTVRKDAYPEFPRLRGRSRNHFARGFDLIARHARARERFKGERSERYGCTAHLGTIQTLQAPALGLPFAIFYF